MISPAQAAEVIKAFMGNPAAQPDEALSEASGVYARACRQVNARIDRCVECLDAGMRTEAVFLAEQEPGLFDLYRVCAFSGSAEWGRIVDLNTSAAHRLEEPPPLRRNDIRRLNDAYVLEDRLLPLLRRHRLLALAGAPVKERLDALWRLLQADPAGPHWAEDVAAMEAARLDEIAREADVADENGDARALAALKTELAAPRWQNEQAAFSLLRKVGEAFSSAQRERTAERYDLLLPRLARAHEARSLPDAWTVRETWERLERKSAFGPSDAQRAAAAPVFAWMDEQRHREEKRRAFADACHALDQAVRSDKPRTEIEKRLRAAETFGMEIPGPVLRSAHKRLEWEELAAERRFRLRLAGLAAGALLVVLGTALLIRFHLSRRRAEDWRTRLARTVEAGDFAATRQLFDALQQADDALFRRPAFQELYGRAERLEAEERARAAHFAEVEATLDPDHVEPYGVALLERLAKTPDEKTRLARWLEQAARAVADEYGRRFGESRRAIETERVALAVGGAAYAPDRLESALEDLRALRRWAETDINARFLDGQPASALDALEKAAETLKTAAAERHKDLAAQRRERDKLFDRIRTAAGHDLDAFAAAVRACADQYPDEPDGGWYRTLAALGWLQERMALETVRRTLTPYLSPVIAVGKDREEAVRGVAALVASGAIHSPEGVRWARAANDYVSRRLRFDDPAVIQGLAGLRGLIAQKVIGDLYWYQETGGFSAYLDSAALDDSMGTALRIEHIRTKQQQRDRVSRNVVRSQIKTSPRLAPHSVFAAALGKQLGDLGRDAAAPAFFLETAVRCLETPDMDPVPQTLFLHALLPLASAFGDADAAKELAPLATVVNEAYTRYALRENGTDPIEWWLLEDGDVRERKDRLRAALRELAPLPAVLAGQLRRDRELREAAPRPTEWVGVLMPGENGTWNLTSRRLPLGGVPYQALDADGNTRPLRLEQGRPVGGDAFFIAQPVLDLQDAEP